MNDKRRPVPCLRSLFKPSKSADDPGDLWDTKQQLTLPEPSEKLVFF